MTADLARVLLLLAAAVGMFLVGRPRMDAAALLIVALLPFTGTITFGEALAGFADPNIILIALLFVLGEGLVRTGIARSLSEAIRERAGSSESRTIALLMITVAGLGAVMSSTGVVAIFIPVVLGIARRSRIPASRLMMPLSIAGLISGMLTLVGTAPNLVVNAELIRRGHEGFHLFSFTPIGLPVLVLALLYLALVRNLPGSPLGAGAPSTAAAEPEHPSLARWIAEYGMEERALRLFVRPGSPLAGQTLETLALRREAGLSILAIERPGRWGVPVSLRPTAGFRVQTGDLLVVDRFDSARTVEELSEELRVERRPLEGSAFGGRGQEIGMAELLLPPRSELIGQTVLEARFRTRFELTVLAIRRGQQVITERVTEESLRAGDVLLAAGPWRGIRRLEAVPSPPLLVLTLPEESADAVPEPARAPLALLALAVTMALMVSGAVSNAHAVLIGCLLMGLFRCIDMEAGYRAIHWQSLILIVGMLPFSLALERTGGVDLAVQGLLSMVGEASPRWILAGIFAVTAFCGMFISNTATAVLLAPVALSVAETLSLAPHPFAMTVAIAASAAFMTPVSSPVNTLVVGPGGYSFADFMKIGIPFALLVGILTVVMVPIVFPF